MKREITIYDIADTLNLSSATISRALNNNESISKATRKRVQDVASKMGYRQNNFASNLRKQKSHTIGIILHELRSSFITSVLAGIEKVTNKAGYDIIITHSSEQAKKEKANANNLFHKRVDGLLASLAFDTSDLDHYLQFEKRNIPVIFFDRVDEQSNYPKVIIDNEKGGYLATRHLIEQGCENIVMITSSLKRNVYAQRVEGFKRAMAEFNLPVNNHSVIVGDLSEESAFRAVKEILSRKKRPDGIFVTNDFVAAICVHELVKNGIKVPQDIAIVGFNNDAISKIVIPELTTVDYPGEYIGEVAAKALLASLTDGDPVNKMSSVIISPELIIRKSSLRKGNRQ